MAIRHRRYVNPVLPVVLALIISASAMAATEQRPANFGADSTAPVAPQVEVALSAAISPSELIGLAQDVERARAMAQEALDKSAEALLYLVLIASILMAFGVGGFRLGMRHIQKRTKAISEKLEGDVTARMEAMFKRSEHELQRAASERSDKLFAKLEENHSKFAQISALLAAGNHDEALEQACWRGDYKVYLQEPESFQRAMITCLARSKAARKDDSHLAAWQWARLLLEKTQDVNNMLTMLRTGITLKNFEQAVELYDEYEGGLLADERDKCEPFLFVAIRRGRKPSNYAEYSERLRQLAVKHRESRDIKLVTNMAAYYRDDGKLEDADRLMAYSVQRLTGGGAMEDGWERLFNTYIANAVDQGAPQRAVRQAEILISRSAEAEHVFTCARLAWRLDAAEQARGSLRRIVRAYYDDGRLPVNSDATIKTAALVHEMRGEKSEAEQVLLDAIDETSQRKESWWSENNLYYYRTLLAQIFLAREDEDSVNRAVEILIEALQSDEEGLVRYLMAKACALEGRDQVMKKHLTDAARIKRKWVMIASHDAALREKSGVNELLSQYASA
jgi:hypothetical protein